MRHLALAIALACLLSGVTRGGEMHPTGAVASPTPSTLTVAGEIHSTGATVPPAPSTVTAPGEIHTTGATAPQGSSTVLTIILTLISIGR